MTDAPDAFDVSVLIVAFRSERLIERCLRAVRAAAQDTRCEILLIDNADGATARLVQSTFPAVQVVPGRGNIGFAAANNALARRAKARMLLLLNPDMVLQPEAIDALMDGARAHPDAAAWGGVSLDAGGRPDTGNAIAVPSLGELASVAMGRSRIGSKPLVGVGRDAEVEVLSGGFVMVDRAAWESVGGLDERYFLYCEEVDLFVRLAREGRTFWRIAAARGAHEAGHGDPASPVRELYRIAGIVEFLRSHRSGPVVVAARLLIWLGAALRVAAGTAFGRWKPGWRARARSNRLVAAKPRLWSHGYDRKRGLLVQMRRGGIAA